MPTAKHNFLERLFTIKKSLYIPNVIDGLPTQTDHNNIARLLRNGLAVVGFVALEDFIKNRTIEILKEVSTSFISFNNLTEDLQYHTTVEVLKSILRIASYQNTKSDKISFIQHETKIISSSLDTAYDLNSYSFGYNNSNITSDEIKKILNSFNIADPWRKMTLLSSTIGLTSLPLDNSFKNAASRRHTAAHNTASTIPIQDLYQYIQEAIAIALTFDALISIAKIKLIHENSNFISKTITIDNNSINLSFVKYENNKWKYKRKGKTKAIKTDIDKTTLLSSERPIAQSNNECLIIYDESNNIIDWQT